MKPVDKVDQKFEADRKEPLSKKVGDKIERAGEKISNAGAEKLGEAISRVGDKLEHSQDKKRNH